MILLYILSPLISWLLLYYLLWSWFRHTLLEKIAISYIMWISLYVLLISFVALIVWWSILYELTYGILFLLTVISIWKKHPFKYLISDIKQWFFEVFKLCNKKSLWLRITWLILIIYCLIKIIMSFMIITSRLTYDEDAVVSWDLKSKVFTYQKNINLDWLSKEFLGTAPSRIIYWPIVDTVLIGSDDTYFDFYSNIMSSITYTIIAIFSIWYMYRKTRNLWIGLLAWYLSLSLPFVFYQSIGSYWNLSFGLWVVMFSIYLSEYMNLLHIDKIEWWKIFILGFLWFWMSAIRNEWIYYMGIILLITSINYFSDIRKLFINKLLAILWGILSFSVVWYIMYKIMLLYQNTVWWVDHLTQITSTNIISKFLENSFQQPVFKELLSQMFYHSDYSFSIILLILLSIVGFWFYSDKENRAHLMQMLVLFLTTVVVLFSNLELWLLTHYVFIRYALSFILFCPIIIAWLIHYIYEREIKILKK